MFGSSESGGGVGRPSGRHGRVVGPRAAKEGSIKATAGSVISSFPADRKHSEAPEEGPATWRCRRHAQRETS